MNDLENVKNLIEPYLKDNNLLQLSLFNFGRRKLKRTFVEWEDNDGSYSLTCNCEHGVPGSREQDCYTACMRIWIKQGMSKGRIEVSYSDIVRELGGKNPKYAVGKIKTSLKKLGGARYEFDQCFVKADKNGNSKVTTQFSLFDSTSLYEHREGASKKDSISILIFPDIIIENLEAEYYQYLDMAWYRSLPEGLSRRLYEYLTKRKYHSRNGNVFTISEKAVCRWLPINDQHITNRRRRIKEITLPLIEKGYLLDYNFDSKKKHCIFTYSNAMPPQENFIREVNVVPSQIVNNAVNPNKDLQLVFIEALDWLKSVPYFHTKKREEIASLSIGYVANIFPSVKQEYCDNKKKGKNLRPSWIYDKFMAHTKTPLFDEVPISYESNSLNNLYKLLKKDTKGVRKIVDVALKIKGFDYVKNNILYANHYAKNSYGNYLSQSLEKNWGGIWAEEKMISEKQQQEIARKKIEEEKRLLEEAKRKKKLEELLNNKKLLFKEQVFNTQKMIRTMLWNEAVGKVPKNAVGKNMNIKIEFSKLLLELFNENKKIYPTDVISDLSFIKEIAKVMEQ